MVKNKSKQVGSNNFLKPSVLLAIAFALIFGGIGGYFIGNSHAATPDSSGTFQLCLNSARSYCIQTHGTGDNTNGQAAVHTGTGTSFHTQSDGKYGKYTKYLIINGAGKCLHTFGNYREYVNVAKCDASATTQQWAQISSSPRKWINVSASEINRGDYYLAANGAGNNNPVYAIPAQSGTWVGWEEK
jgi:hypothetical protein